MMQSFFKRSVKPKDKDESLLPPTSTSTTKKRKFKKKIFSLMHDWLKFEIIEAEEVVVTSSEQQKLTDGIWLKYKEGFINAVRYNIRIDQLL